MGRHLSNLPTEVTSFVGRRQELREVKRLLSTTRLLTLTGSGGVGKTKLALRAAAEMARAFPDGAWLVLLDSIRDPLLVTQAVFNALRVHDLSAGLSLSSLTDYLAGKRLLLMMDNCEHLLDGCAVLASTLIGSCPDLHVLATSRQALGVAGEIRMIVPPMSLPAETDGTSVPRLIGCDAVWLLSERAAAVVPGFTVDAANAGQVLTLCRKLDGIPLALELAAVRLGSLSLEQLNEGLAGELSILGTANRGAEARQQTLEATISWSYGLLDEQEQLLWARLSVFAGGFEEDAATEVCTDRRIPAEHIAGLLGALVDKSILKRQLKSADPPRYWLLAFLAQAIWLRGEKPRAEALAREAAACKHALDDRNGLTIALGTLAWMAAECGQHERAAILLGCSQRVRDETSLTLLEPFRQQHERSVSIILRRIGQKALDAAFARDRTMSIDEGVAFAVKDRQLPGSVPAVKATRDMELTRRQLEIARLIAEDLTNRQIAERLFLSERTVETHITNMLNKLGLNSRIRLSRWLADGA